MGVIYLCPVPGAIVVLDRARRLGDIYEARTGVLNKLVVEDLEPDLVACLDSIRGSVSRSRTLVAAQVVGVHELRGERRVVCVAVFASVGVLAANGCAVDDEAVEDVVCVCTKGREQREDGDGLHGCWWEEGG